MEGNWRPTLPDASMASSMDAASGDWRNQLQPEARQRIVNKIMETLKRHLPTSVPEGLNELRKIAIRFEEKIYTAATSQLDYLGKLSLKMLSMETETQQSAPINPALSNAGGVNQNPTDPALGMQSQANNPGQPLAVPNRPEVLPQNLQNNTSAAMQDSSGPAPALTSISGLTQSNISGVTQASNLQNMPGISQGSVNNSTGPGAQTDIYANARRQMQERQRQQQVISQQPQQQQQQRQSQNPLMYQHQLQQRMLNQRMQQQQQQEQQQQQSLLQPNQLQSTQPSLMQMSSSLQSNQSNIQQTQAGSTQSAPQTGLQQNQLNEIQQSVPSLLQSNPQSVARQQQAQSLHQQAPSVQQQSMPISQQSNLSQQQQQMMGQQGNMPNMQQNQLLGPQNSIGDIQQQQPRLPIQQNSFLNMKQQQQMMNQQTLALLQQQQQQQHQLGSQSCMSGLQQQQQMLGPLTSVSNMQPHQRAMLVQKNAAQQQQQQQQLPLTLLQPQGPQSQHQSLQQQLMSQYQSQPAQSQQQLMMQQQTNSLQRGMQQRLQGSGPLVQAQNAMEQKPFIQAQRGLPVVSSSTSMDSTAQTGHAGGVDWREECYQKVKAMKELYFADLTEFHQKIAQKLQQQEALIPPGKQSQQHEKLKSFRIMLERMLALLQINKNNIPVGMKEKLTMYEKQMMNMVAVNRSKKISPQVQGQQQLQHPNLGNAHPIPQQQQSQVSQMHPDNQANQRAEVSEKVVPEETSSGHFCTGGTEKAKEPTFNCPICMCTMVSPFSTICGHIFCEDCIRAAIKRRKECPTCRAKLTGKNNIHRVFLPTAD